VKLFALIIFSRPYLSNGRAIVIVVVCPSVRLSVRHRFTVAKRCKIRFRLLLIIKWKSHTGLQMIYTGWSKNGTKLMIP